MCVLYSVLLHLLCYPTSTLGPIARNDEGTMAPIQQILEIDSIVQLPHDYDPEYGPAMSVAFSDSHCVFTFVEKEFRDHKNLGVALVTLSDFNLDTLRFDDTAIERVDGINQNERGSLHAIGLKERSLAMLFDSSLVIYSIKGKLAAARNGYRVPAGYGAIDWLDDSHVLLHPKGYHHPNSLNSHEDLYIVNIQSGEVSQVTLPDAEAAIFRLFAPNRFVAVAFGTIWYIRPTDGSLFRLSKSNQWEYAWRGSYTVNGELLQIARNSASKQLRSQNKKSLIHLIDSTINSEQLSYVTSVEFDEQCSIVYLITYCGEDSLGKIRPMRVQSIFLKNNQGPMIATYTNTSQSSDVICSRSTYPVDIGGLNSRLQGRFLYKLGHRAPMSTAYRVGVSLKHLAKAELDYKLKHGSKVTVTRYRYKQPCVN